MALTDKLTSIANAIREKTGGTELLTLDQMPTEIAGIKTGGASVAEKDVNFYDYDGTVLYAYTVEEAQALTELPALPEREGLICQGWNWSLEDIKAHNRAVNVGAMYITDDGKTRIYISLKEGRTSPLLGVCPNGTVTVDWGDGTEPDVLTGTSTTSVKWTPTHNYASASDYVISLTVDGEMGFVGETSGNDSVILRYSSGNDGRNAAYRNSVRKIAIGSGVTSFGQFAFGLCYSLKSISVPNGVTSFGSYAFYRCHNLTSVAIPNGVKGIFPNVFKECYNLTSVAIPNGVTNINSSAFCNCCSLKSISIPNSVVIAYDSAFEACYSLNSVAIPYGNQIINNEAFRECYSLTNVVIPNTLTKINASAFRDCHSLKSISIPNGVTTIGSYAFYNCYSLTSVAIPNGVTSFGYSEFGGCRGLRYVDFSNHTTVPTLSSTSAFTSIPSDCEIRVPAALYDEWIAATNWSTYASQIVAV